MSFNIAIDGPAGAGKSTIARKAAEMLGFIYVDTGAMYRAIAYYLLKEGIDPDNTEAIAAACTGADIEIRYEDGEQIVLLNGENVNSYIRTEEVSIMASRSSAVPEVRQHLLELQRSLARTHDTVMDGRDIGTTVLPDASLKIYLTASDEVRADRRYAELKEKGEQVSYEDVLKDIRERDERDMNRSVSPLRRADDAHLIDSSYMTPEEVLLEIMSLISSTGTE
ncbi:MAG: (d)CMP kinase [Blautia sp.]|nr:(d)CMP kinase [Blautia sp.]